ncbi:MAG: DNA polymerase III subunit delta' [Candidatus Omnitrophica bacterium]|nr:DNA polymerase III subunit delta' [Candidatus Omnitrophota bacterium]
MPLRDIRGQEKAVDILRSSIKEKRIAGAYLFLGPEGVGKAKTALEFVKSLNCQDAGDDACGTCSSCERIDKSAHPDIYIIERDSTGKKISIDKVRALQKRLSLKPFESVYKAAIITGAEHMTEEASNCLLKILEEPPRDTVFILVAAGLKALPATVISRCQVVRFRPLKRDDVNDILMKDFSTEKDEANFLSAIAGGNLDKALALKEKDALAWKNRIIDTFNDASDFALSDDKGGILSRNRQSQMDAMDILSGFFRDVLIYKITDDTGLIMNIDRQELIADLAQRLDADRIQAYMKDIENTKSLLESNCNAKLAIRSLGEKITV